MMKLYKVKTKMDNKEKMFALEDMNDNIAQVKKFLKEIIYWEDFDLRTLKEIEFPKGRLEVSDLSDMHYIVYDGKPIVSWSDSAIRDYPEDLVWSRDISILIGEVERLKELEFEDRLKRRHKKKIGEVDIEDQSKNYKAKIIIEDRGTGNEMIIEDIENVSYTLKNDIEEIGILGSLRPMRASRGMEVSLTGYKVNRDYEEDMLRESNSVEDK